MPDNYISSVTTQTIEVVQAQPKREVIEVIARGPQGPQGPRGADGTGDRHHIHTQAMAADTWLIEHGLGKQPAVTVVDSAGDQVEGDVTYINLDTVRVSFSAAFAGRAFCN